MLTFAEAGVGLGLVGGWGGWGRVVEEAGADILVLKYKAEIEMILNLKMNETQKNGTW